MCAYGLQGFCEEFIKYLAIRRIEKSVLTADWRALMVYGLAAGCGFAVTENIMYVLSGGLVTAVVRAFLSVPLHCTTGALIGMAVAKGRTGGNRSKLWRGEKPIRSHINLLKLSDPQLCCFSVIFTVVSAWKL